MEIDKTTPTLPQGSNHFKNATSVFESCKVYCIVQDEYEELKSDDFTGTFTEAQLKWIKALESGNYRQMIHQLRYEHEQSNSVGYCCLGVACETFNLPYTPKPDGYDEMSEQQKAELRYGYAFPNALFSNGVFESISLLNLKSNTGGFNTTEPISGACVHYGVSDGDHWFYSLTELNDAARFTFKEIAYILRHFPQLVFTNFSSKTSESALSDSDLFNATNQPDPIS